MVERERGDRKAIACFALRSLRAKLRPLKQLRPPRGRTFERGPTRHAGRGPRRTPSRPPAPPAQPAEPFLKWAGGKRQLLPELRAFYPRVFGGYVEPFVGSGAVYFDLHRLGLLAGRRVVLADTNVDIIGCYEAIRRDVEGVVAHLARLAHEHAARGRDHYYEVRDGRFNPSRRALLARADIEAGAVPEYPAAVAAMLIYLNRTGFNGLFRLNSQGLFNVPAGRYANPRVCDADNLRAVSRALREPGVEIRFQSFEAVLREAKGDDFFYFDPPYAPLSETACFTSYTADGFTDWHQRRLQRTAVALAARGCHVVLSNSTAPIVQELYVRNATARRAGLSAHTVLARRAINARASCRGPVREFIITNQPRHARPL